MFTTKLARLAIAAVDDEDCPDEKDARGEEIDGGDCGGCGCDSSIVRQAVEIPSGDCRIGSDDGAGYCEEDKRAIRNCHQLASVESE